MLTTKYEEQGLQLPNLPEEAPAQEETVYYLEAANGMLVRVPESRLEAWIAEQDRLRQNKAQTPELTESEKLLRDRILQEIFGSKK